MSKTSIAAVDAAAFNTDLHELRGLARKIVGDDDIYGAVMVTETVMPESQAPMLFGTRWPHDYAADLLCAWQLERHTP